MKKIILLVCISMIIVFLAASTGWSQNYKLIKHFGYLDGFANAMKFPVGIFVQEGKGTKNECDDGCKNYLDGYQAKCNKSCQADPTRIYVADCENHRIEKYDMNGNLLKRWGEASPPVKPPIKPYDCVIDKTGSIHTSCQYYDRIMRVNSKGFNNHVFKNNHWYYAEIGKKINVTCDDPRGMALDPSGNIVIADYGYRKIFIFSPQKKFISSFSTKLEGDFDILPDNEKKSYDPLPRPIDVAVDSQGNIFVCYNKCFGIRKFSANGQPAGDFPKELSITDSDMKLGGIALDKNGNIFATDTTKNVVYKLNPQGNVETSWGQFGYLPGYFNCPMGICVDSKDRVYVVDRGNHRVQIFAP